MRNVDHGRKNIPRKFFLVIALANSREVLLPRSNIKSSEYVVLKFRFAVSEEKSERRWDDKTRRNK